MRGHGPGVGGFVGDVLLGGGESWRDFEGKVSQEEGVDAEAEFGREGEEGGWNGKGRSGHGGEAVGWSGEQWEVARPCS